jgi:hypothetical protein
LLQSKFPVRITLFEKMTSQMMTTHEIAKALRVLSIDAVYQANSGHPGMPLGMADIAAVLWTHFLKFNPKNPHWFNRDRFILSNGHGSMLHYALLHLFGFKVSLENLKNFRQLHSNTPGHPERGHTPGIEVTTGPLSQGLANGVGMAFAEKSLHAQYPLLVDHHTYMKAAHLPVSINSINSLHFMTVTALPLMDQHRLESKKKPSHVSKVIIGTSSKLMDMITMLFIAPFKLVKHKTNRH